VIGVMPAGFRFPVNMRNAIYTPMHLDKHGWLAEATTGCAPSDM